jgi:hypothetical protein
LEAFPAVRANGSAARLLKFLAAKQTIGRKHYSKQGAEQFRQEGEGRRFVVDGEREG